MGIYIRNALLLAIAIILSATATTSSAGAVSASEWRAGRIIDDGMFTNAGDMSATDIQNFLNSLVPNCDTWGTQPSGYGGTRAQYAASKGYSVPFTCLKDYYEVPKTSPGPGEPASNYGGAAIPPGAQSAAQIIANASRKYNINPKVLLVKLATESPGPLTTDDWPFKKQYLYAMGAHCPDSGPGGSANCDVNYSGFSLQMDEAASLLRWYLDSMTQSWWQYKKPYQDNYVMWNVVERGCGGSNVYIESKATAALYTYTPYQPNQAALNNLYGTGDNCSAYGNRNFWRVFRDWFGSVYSPLFFSYYSSQSSLPELKPGGTATVNISFVNAGTGVWFDDSSYPVAPGSPYRYPVKLATNNPLNRESRFSASWPANNRASTLFSAVYEANGTTPAANPHTVKPGQVGQFSFNIAVPEGTPPGTYREYFKLIAEGTTDGAFNDVGAYFDVVVKPDPALQWVSQTHHPTTKASEKIDFRIDVKNTGNVNLYDDRSNPQGSYPVHLATACPINKLSDFSDGWPAKNRPALTFSKVLDSSGNPSPVSHTAKPGETIRFEFQLTIPEGYPASAYRECFQPILEGTPDGYFKNLGIYSDITVLSAPVAKTTARPERIDITAREELSTSVSIKNTGNALIPAGSKLKIASPYNFRHNSWQSDSTVMTTTSPVNSGESLALPIKLLAPFVEEKSNSSINLYIENPDSTARITSSNISINTSIWTESYLASYSGQSPYPSLGSDEVDSTYIRFKNTGNKPWYDDIGITSASSRDPLPTHLSTAAPINRGSGFAFNWSSSNRPALVFSAVYESDGSTLASNQHIVKPGQVGEFSFQQKPASWVKKGVYREYFQPVLEGTPTGNFNFVGTYIDISVR